MAHTSEKGSGYGSHFAEKVVVMAHTSSGYGSHFAEKVVVMAHTSRKK